MPPIMSPRTVAAKSIFFIVYAHPFTENTFTPSCPHRNALQRIPEILNTEHRSFVSALIG
ncbi:MAG: hypothetical protein D6741_15285 [Planctomycetota bacterium]|nr:MAG: hypothetical protein D6741_15285 [Planctomycetota bacterium]